MLKELQESITASNKELDRATESIYSYIQESVSDPISQVKAEIWLPKAKLARMHTLSVMRFIDSLKESFKTSDSFKDSNSTSGTHDYFIKEEKGKELYKSLLLYKQNIQNIDSFVVRGLGNLDVFNKEIDSTQDKEQVFLQKYFAATTQAGVMALLTNFQYKIKVIENRVVQLFSEQWTNHFVEDYVMYSAIVAQSSKHAKPGEELEVIAGLGSFNVGASPTITINRNKVALGAEGAAHYKFKAAERSGKHIIPTLIEFTDREGKRVQIAKDVEYFVDEE